LTLRPAEGIRESFAVAVDGTRLYVRERDRQPPRGRRRLREAKRPTAVLCDGLSCDGYIWKYLWDDLVESAALCHWHYRDHGRSEPAADPSRIDVPSHASDLDCVRLSIGDPLVVLIGHSMGCQVVLEAYRQRPAGVRGLVLMNGSSGRITETFHGTNLLARALPKLQELAEKHADLARALWSRIPVGLTLRVALQAGEVDHDLLHPEDLVPYLEALTRMDVRVFLRMLKAAGDHSADDWLHTVTVPALVIAGERDTFTPPELAERLSRMLPDARLVMVPGGTHVTALEHRELVRDEICRFLLRVGDHAPH
jgi:pimeloyl-ACP methyl ester carboxylesterase